MYGQCCCANAKRRHSQWHDHMNMIESFEMWYYRKMLKEHVKNEFVLQLIHKKRELLKTLKRRKLE